MQRKSLRLLILLLALSPVVLPAAEPARLRLSMTFAPGEDVGQKLGSLFEVHDAQGRVVAGAGFTHIDSRGVAGSQCRVGNMYPGFPECVKTDVYMPGTFVSGRQGQCFVFSKLRAGPVPPT